MKNPPFEILIFAGVLIVILIYIMKSILHKKGYHVYWLRGNHFKDFSNFSKLISNENTNSKKIKYRILFGAIIILLLIYIGFWVYLFIKK